MNNTTNDLSTSPLISSDIDSASHATQILFMATSMFAVTFMVGYLPTKLSAS